MPSVFITSSSVSASDTLTELGRTNMKPWEQL